jgi:hypothetical protein
MATKNDVTGDSLISKVNTQAYEDNYDLIFRKRKVETEDGYEEEERLERIAKEIIKPTEVG